MIWLLQADGPPYLGIKGTAQLLTLQCPLVAKTHTDLRAWRNGHLNNPCLRQQVKGELRPWGEGGFGGLVFWPQHRYHYLAPPPPVTRCAYLQAFVSHVWRERPLSLDLQVGFFWNAAPCGRCLGRGRRCDGPSQTGNGYLAASSAGREQGWAGLRPGIRNSGFYSCLWNPGHHRRAAQPLRLSVPNCVMDRIVFLSSTLSISLLWLENRMRSQKEKGCGV